MPAQGLERCDTAHAAAARAERLGGDACAGARTLRPTCRRVRSRVRHAVEMPAQGLERCDAEFSFECENERYVEMPAQGFGRCDPTTTTDPRVGAAIVEMPAQGLGRCDLPHRREDGA